MKKCVILLGGECVATPRLIEQCRGAFVIAADSGVRHAAALGLGVECWLGDFDSTTPDLAAHYAHVPRKVFPVEKDKTDGELAIEEGLSRGMRRFILVGAFGGARADHALLHNFQALALARQGCHVLLTNGVQEATPVLSGEYHFDLSIGALFSLVGFGPLHGVTLTGAKWPLTDRDVDAGSSLTLSNIATGAVSIKVEAGEALFISGSVGAH